ncbi:hypothetical protein HDU81_000086 [Chytriomyces hyalinus]|nr:hypothetical protein HDU81_000086 [Chytriomyces hyalinus]
MHFINSLLTVAALAVTLSSARPLPKPSTSPVTLTESTTTSTTFTVSHTNTKKASPKKTDKKSKAYSKTTAKKPKTTGKKVKTTGKKAKANKTPKGAGAKTVTPSATSISATESTDSGDLLIGNAAKEPAATAPACTQVGACLYKNPSSASEHNELPSGSCLNNTGMYLYMQADGNLVAYKGAKSAIWSTGTASTTGTYVFRYSSSTGNFNMYSGDNVILPGDTWALSAAGQTADSLCLLANGDFGMFQGGLSGTKVVSIVSTGDL